MQLVVGDSAADHKWLYIFSTFMSCASVSALRARHDASDRTGQALGQALGQESFLLKIARW